jgi:hypothetical protein
VRLSFAHAEGRNYRQLPSRARLREKPSPADIFYSKRYSVSRLRVSGETCFSAQQYRPKSNSRSVCALAGGEMGGKPNLPTCFGVLWRPGVMLALESGGICAVPACHRSLVTPDSDFVAGDGF